MLDSIKMGSKLKKKSFLIGRGKVMVLVNEKGIISLLSSYHVFVNVNVM